MDNELMEWLSSSGSELWDGRNRYENQMKKDRGMASLVTAEYWTERKPAGVVWGGVGWCGVG